MATPEGSQTLWRANLIVACGTALSRVTGLIRIIVFGVMIGQTALADAYDAANNAPNVVYELLLGGVLAASLVPLFTRYIQDGDDDSVNAISSFAVVALASITALALLASPLIFRVFSLNPSNEIDVTMFRSTGTSLTRLFIIQIFFYGLTAIASAILNSKRRFFAAAWTPVVANLVTIFTLLAIPRVTSMKPPTINEVSTNRSLQLLLGLGSTFGIIAPGEYNFPTGNNQETMTYLAGELMAGSGHNAMHSLKAGEVIIVPAESVLRMRVEKEEGNVLYHCAYEERKAA